SRLASRPLSHPVCLSRPNNPHCCRLAGESVESTNGAIPTAGQQEPIVRSFLPCVSPFAPASSDRYTRRLHPDQSVVPLHARGPSALQAVDAPPITFLKNDESVLKKLQRLCIDVGPRFRDQFDRDDLLRIEFGVCGRAREGNASIDVDPPLDRAEGRQN